MMGNTVIWVGKPQKLLLKALAPAAECRIKTNSLLPFVVGHGAQEKVRNKDDRSLRRQSSADDSRT